MCIEENSIRDNDTQLQYQGLAPFGVASSTQSKSMAPATKYAHVSTLFFIAYSNQLHVCTEGLYNSINSTNWNHQCVATWDVSIDAGQLSSNLLLVNTDMALTCLSVNQEC